MDPEAAHKHCTNHRTEILASSRCGCFSCASIFSPSEIQEWIDESDDGIGQTAVCPHCQVEALIGSASGLALTAEFLTGMRARWFE